MQRVLLIMTSTALLFLGLATCGPQLKRPEISRALLESEKERQKEFSLNLFMQRYEQLIRVGTALQIKGVELCGESVEPVVGALLLERKAFPDDLQETASRVFGLNQGLHVRYVVPGLPAATAGLKQGDEVTMIGDTSLGSPAESTNESKFDKAKTLLKQYGTTPVKLEVRRDGKSLPLTMTPNLGCRFPISLVQNDNVNAFADGEKVGITTGMVRFVADD
ncbi:MAG: M48 family metallopeptidase, partial [Deltaproteobacteria bacterium]|nr:M48 family metallopeptidase [Deltaproteobacteria bacterium]